MRKITPPQTILFISALSAILMGLIWVFFISPLATKLPADYQQSASYFGTIKKYDLQDQTITSNDIIERRVLEQNEGVQKNAIYIKRTDSISNYIDRNILAQNEDKFMANRIDRSFINVRSGMYFLFPQNTKQDDYNNVLFSIYPGIYTTNIKYSHEENLLGLTVLVFRYEETGINVDNEDKVKKADLSGKIWVEPKTGFVIKYENNWGFYTLDETNDKKMIESGRMWQQDEETKRLVRTVQSKKAVYQIYEMWIPLYLLIFAIAAGIGAFLKGSG